jgi:predicted PurR-regulated permease PerM
MIKWLATVFLIWFAWRVRMVFPPFIMGAIIAYLLLPLVQQLSSKLKVKIGYSVAIVYLFGLGMLSLLSWAFLPTLGDQFAAMATNRYEIVADIIRQASTTFNRQIDVDSTAEQIVGSIEDTLGTPEELMHLGGVVGRGALSVLVCLLSSIYFIVDSSRVADFILRFVPEERREAVVNLSGRLNRMLSKYVQGQLVLIVIMSTVAWLFLHYVIHLRYALVIAIASGFLEIIPVLGPIAATTIAALVGFAQFDLMVALGIVVFYIAARWIEDYVVVPRVIGHAVELHPLAVIFAVLCGETLAGALGMLIAIPVAASIKILLDFTYPSPETTALGEDAVGTGKPA